MGLALGPVLPRFHGVERIAVLRGGGLGDLLFTMPALASLAAAYPGARITVLGAPVARALLAGRPSPVAEVVLLPPARGVHEPAGTPLDDATARAARERFDAEVAAHRPDLAVQLHGGGRWSNPFVAGLGARHTVGPATGDALPLERSGPFRYYQHEVLRALEVAGWAGAEPVALQPVITEVDADRAAAGPFLAGLPRPLLAVHPGATDPRRRWPAERFAEVVAAVVAGGAAAVVVGDRGERDLTRAVTGDVTGRLPAGARDRVRDLGGALGLPGLVGVLATADALLAGDSGPRHLAQAVGTPTVGLYWMGNVINAGPFGRSRDRVQISWTAACERCGASFTDVLVPRCAHDDSILTGIGPPEVLAEVWALLAGDRPARCGG